LTAPILGARKLAHLDDNLGCLDFELTEAARERLDTVSAPTPGFLNNFGRTPMFRAAFDGELDIEGGYRELY